MITTDTFTSTDFKQIFTDMPFISKCTLIAGSVILGAFSIVIAIFTFAAGTMMLMLLALHQRFTQHKPNDTYQTPTSKTDTTIV